MKTGTGETAGRVWWAISGMCAGLVILIMGWSLPGWTRSLPQDQISYIQSVAANVGVAVLLAGLLILLERKIIESTARRVRVARTAEFVRRTDPTAHAASVMRLFEKRRETGLLYTTVSLPRGMNRSIPIIDVTNQSWRIRLELDRDAPFSLQDPSRYELGYDKEPIVWRQSHGVRLWDGSILYAQTSDAHAEHLAVGVGNYFAFVAQSDRVLREVDSPWRRKPLTDLLSNPPLALSEPSLPLVLSGAAVCVFESPEGPVFALQRRSQQFVSARGMLAVSPVFGMEPNHVGGKPSRYGIPIYNFAKEFLEEIFNQDDTKHAGDRPRLDDSDSIFRSPEAERLIEELKKSNTVVQITGSAIDPSEGSLVFSYLVHFKSRAFYKYVRSRAYGNWEAEQSVGLAKISFRSIDDVDDIMSIDKMAVTSLYALDRARATMASTEA